MATSGGNSLDTILSKEEIERIPENVYAKIKTYFEEIFDEYLTSKALFESSKVKHEQKTSALEKELEECKNALAEDQTKLTAVQEELESLKAKHEEAQKELSNLRESVGRLESENNDLRRKRNDAEDERDSLIKMVERRTAEMERLDSDVKRLTQELSVAINAKCEALAAADDVRSREAALNFKEETMKNEKEYLNTKIQNLSKDLHKCELELSNLRKDNATRVVTLQTQLAAKTEELRIAVEKDEQLTANNEELTAKVENLAARLMGMRESETAMEESYHQELQSKTKLAGIYKRMVDDSNSKIEELTEAVQALQQLVQEAGQHYDELEEKRAAEEAKHNEVLEAKNQCIAALKNELKDANNLIEAIKQDTIEQTVEGLSPAAAAASKLLKSGLTLTQIYSQYVAMGEELVTVKEENQKLNQSINTIFQELEEKAPLILEQRKNYENAVECVTSLCKQSDDLIEETRQLRAELSELKKSAGDHEREKDRLRQEVKDLSRQVCYLLKEVEEARGGVVSMEDDTYLNISSGADDVIAKRLVTFRGIEDLQSKNQQLLAIVHVLSAKQEELENTQKDMDIPTLQESIKCLNMEVSNLRESTSQQKQMLEQVVRQRDMYRDMYEKTVKGDPADKAKEDQPMGLKTPPSQKTPQAPSVSPSVLSAKEAQIQELQKRLEAKENHLKALKTDYEDYRKERRTHEEMLTEQTESWVTQIRELTVENAKLTTQNEYQIERFNVLKSNLASQKSQITALEEKCAIYSSTIAKNEATIKQLMDETMAAQTKLSKAEVDVEHLREENRLLRDTETRLRLEKESKERVATTQALLMANLESIKTALDRTETEGRMRLEQRLDDANRECSALRRRLQEEQEHFRELSGGLERQTAAAVARQEEERAIAERARAELNTARQELAKKTALIEQLDAKVREAARTPPVVIQKKDDQLSMRMRQLEGRLAAAENQVKSLREQLAKANEHNRQFRSIAESSERQVQEMTAMYKKETDELENRLKEAQSTETELRERTRQLEQRVAELEAVGNQSMTDLSERATQVESRLQTLLKEKELIEQERNVIRAQLDDVVAQLQSATEARKEAEEKYAHEVVLHSNDIQAQETLKEELNALNTEVAQLRAAKEQAEEALAAHHNSFEEVNEQRARELQEMKQQLQDVSTQNNMLHDQLQVLGTQLALLQSRTPPTPSSSNASDEEFRGSAQLLEVVKFLRRETQLSAARVEALNAENARLRSEHELATKQLTETREALQQVKREAASEGATSARHQELLRKVETVNALTDSNRILRNERDQLREKVNNLEQEKTELELKLAPLEEQNRNLVSQAECARAETVALNEDIGRWRKRCSDLIERANKTDWKRLNNERDALAKQLAMEKEAHTKTQEVAQAWEEQIQAANRRIAALESELHAAQESKNSELTAARNKIAALEAELAQREAALTEQTALAKKLKEENLSVTEKEAQVRRIARRYKLSYDDLLKKHEELTKEKEQAQATAPGSAMLSADAQEELRQEGRREAEGRLRETIWAQQEQIREAEQRLKDQETAHNEKLTEVSSQVSSSKEEAESLRQENETLRQREEQLQTLMKNARMKLSVLNGDKATLEQQLSEANQRHLKDSEENKKRFNVLKSQYESKLVRADKEKAEALAERGERERLQRELENMTARCSLLQRQLEKQSGKPSTSSGSEKGSAEPPPTANIKPMAGPSSAAAKQQTQQAATVSPWRAGSETPLASIRPIQTRMAAVSPQTSQQSSSTVVLAPLQQTTQQQVPTSQPQSQPSQQSSQQQQQQQSNQQQQGSQIQAVTQQQPVPPLVHAVAPAAVLAQAPQAPPTQQSPSQQAVHTTEASTATLTSGAGSMEATSSHTDYMPATSSAKQQLNVGPSTSRGREEAGAESTQDMEVEGGSRASVVAIASVPQTAQQGIPSHGNQPGQQSSPQVQQQQQQQQPPPQQAQQQSTPQRNVPQQQGQQHAVAMVLPRERSEQQAQVQQVVPQAPVIQAQPQQQQSVPQQQAVVSPPQAGAVPPAQGDAPQQQQAGSVASSQQASSSSTVTTSGSQGGLKRPRDSEGEGLQGRPEPNKVVPQPKRTRRGMMGSGTPGEPLFQAVESSDCGRLEVEYQVPTSSQRDQEDDIIDVTSEDDDDDEDEPADEEDDEDVEGMVDDGLAEDGSADEGGMELEDNDGYVIEVYRDDPANYDEGEGPDIDDVNAGVNNEVEIIDDSNEVPSQTGSTDPGRSDSGRSDPGPSQAVGSSAPLGEARRSPQQTTQPQPQQQQQQVDQQQQQQMIQQQSSSSEATSSGVVNQSDNGNSSGSGNGGPPGNNQVSSQGLPFLRNRANNRQQQLLLPQSYEGDTSDDCIVPSTPTLFVPRRTDGFGEAVSSPQVPSAARFTFTDSNQPSTRAAVAVCEGMDDTRMDLSQLEEPGTGRSVPTTPLQVSPQGENVGGELSGEVGDSGSAGPSGESSVSVAVSEASHSHGSAGPVIPTITVTGTDQQPGIDQENLEMELDAEQRELGVEGPAEEPEEVVILDVEDENGDGVSSEGQKLGQPLRPLAEEGREAEASRPAASSPQGSPHASEMLAGSDMFAGGDAVPRGGQTARRSARGGIFARRGRAANRPKPNPIIWSEPGSSSMSARGGRSSTSSSGSETGPRVGVMGQAFSLNQGFGIHRIQRGRRAGPRRR